MAGIGSTLREARMRAQLDITDFEVRTKIRGKYLRALEDEEWNLLPGYTFTKGFLRTYADMLGLDGRALVDEFKRQYRDPSEHDPAPSAPTRRDGRRSRERPRERPGDRVRQRPAGSGSNRPVPIVVVVVVLAVLLGAALYALGKLGHKNHPTTTSTTTTHTTSSSHSHTTTTPPPVAPAVAALQLVPSGRVYVCLVGYPGSSNRRPHVRINGLILTPASSRPVYHDNHFLVTFGNNALAMVINGHRHAVPASTAAISYEISRDGTYKTLSASQAPHCP